MHLEIRWPKNYNKFCLPLHWRETKHMASAAEKNNTSCMLTVVIRQYCLKIIKISTLDGKQWWNSTIYQELPPSFYPLPLQWCKNIWLKKKTCATDCLDRWIYFKYLHSSSGFKAPGSFLFATIHPEWYSFLENSEEKLFFKISYRKHFVPASKFTSLTPAVNFRSLDCTNSLLTFPESKEYLISHNYIYQTTLFFWSKQ